jgi:hypothetical protein
MGELAPFAGRPVSVDRIRRLANVEGVMGATVTSLEGRDSLLQALRIAASGKVCNAINPQSIASN